VLGCCVFQNIVPSKFVNDPFAVKKSKCVTEKLMVDLDLFNVK
jgi:hypothetical protein